MADSASSGVLLFLRLPPATELMTPSLALPNH